MFFYKIKNIVSACLVQSKFLLFAIFLYPASILYRYLNNMDSLWLIGENEGKCLGDNAYVFFVFCRKNYPDRHIYFITNKASLKVSPFLNQDSNIIYYGSVKHVFFFLLSNTLIYSHAQSDVGYI